MDLVSLILMCSIAQSTHTNTLLYQIAQTTNANSTYIDDLTDAQVYTPDRVRDAQKIVAALVEAGHDIRAGMMQLPAREVMIQYNLLPKDLINSCRSVSVASDRLTQARARYPKDDRRALSWYLTGEPDSSLGIGWAFDVLDVPAVQLDAELGNVEKPTPSPKFSRPKGLIFSSDSSGNHGQLKTSRPLTYKVLVDTPRTKVVPKKWTPVASPSVKGKHLDTSDTTHRSKSSKAGSKPSEVRGAHKPQPPVTDERLQTSDDIDAKADKEKQ